MLSSLHRKLEEFEEFTEPIRKLASEGKTQDKYTYLSFFKKMGGLIPLEQLSNEDFELLYVYEEVTKEELALLCDATINQIEVRIELQGLQKYDHPLPVIIYQLKEFFKEDPKTLTFLLGCFPIEKKKGVNK